ncbi:MAG: carbohydrate kinase [Clostridia bacterium]|nr:carbohydrate kinase [Clostridia bacterium]
MILSIGEILADMIGTEKDGKSTYQAFCGGAPFNLAVNACLAGAKVGFIGRVGNDPMGRFLQERAAKASLSYLDIQVDEVRNTTLAFVSLKDGERDFAFHRHDTADYHIQTSKINFCDQNLSIVHLGSLMLSEQEGRAVAEEIANRTRSAGKKLSFDVNFRKDIYRDFQEAVTIYQLFIEKADIVKFSEEEIMEYTGESDLISAMQSVYRKDMLLIVTLGAKGCMYRLNELQGIIPSEKVKPIDTTGAGDAFFGTFLACIENKEWKKDNIENALSLANKAGALTTQFLGAIQL